MLPFSKTVTGTACNPTGPAATFTDCATVNVDGSTGFPRKYYVSFDGNFDNATNVPAGAVARGDCRIEVDNAPSPAPRSGSRPRTIRPTTATATAST